MYDVLYIKNEFENQSIEMYSERTIPLAAQNRRTIKVDINNNFDGIWDDEEDDTTDDDVGDDGQGES